MRIRQAAAVHAANLPRQSPINNGMKRPPNRAAIERKQLLLDLLGENDIELPVLYSEHLVGDGQKNV
ncbi:hypothetical protein [Bradyrhizobium sp. URHC0002]